MKKILLLALLICSISFAQNKDYTLISVVQSPNSLGDGFSLGLQIEGRNNILYYGAELYSFPDLNNIDYNHVIGRVGLQHNIFTNEFRKPLLTIHAGPRAGSILREGRIYPLLGLESGFDVFLFQSKFFIGASFTSDMKADSKLWSTDSHHTVNSGLIRIGFTY